MPSKKNKRKARQDLRARISAPPTDADLAEEAAGKVIRFTQQETLGLMLETAIMRWFDEDEPLSIHLIASAAYRCLNDLADKIGTIRSAVGDDQFTLVYDYLRHAWANRDLDLVLPRGANRWLLFEALGLFESYFRQRSSLMGVFQLYFMLYCLSRPATSQELTEFLPNKVPVETFLNLKRTEFVDKTLPFFAGSVGPAKASLWAFRKAHLPKPS